MIFTIKIFGDFHTHTTYSHGTGSILDNVLAAKVKGLTEIAITDHGVDHLLYAVKREKLPEMRAEIDRINGLGLGVKVLLGLECNVLGTEGQVDLTDEIMQYLDIVLLGYHLTAKAANLSGAWNLYVRNYWIRKFKKSYETVAERNTYSLIKAIETYPVKFITHPGARVPVNVQKLAEAAVKRDVALEINCKGNALTVEDIRKAAQTGVKFIIDSDAHSPEKVGVLEDGIRLAEEAGLTPAQIINAVK